MSKVEKAKDSRSQGNLKETEYVYGFHPKSTRVSTKTSLKGTWMP